MNQNLFIIGPAGSGKSTILDLLKTKYNLDVVDTGMLFRLLASKVMEVDGFTGESKTLINKLNGSKELFESILKDVEYKNNSFYHKGQQADKESLKTSQVDDFVRVFAKSNVVRNQIMNHLNVLPDKNKGNFAWTGHNINGMDTTKFTTIFLDVADSEVVKRLKSNPDETRTDEEILQSIAKRNNDDGINITREIVKKVYNACIIDTTGKPHEEIIENISEHLERVETARSCFNELQQQKAIDKKNFKKDLHNPFLDVIADISKSHIAGVVKNNPELNKGDLLYQVLINCCANNPSLYFEAESGYIERINEAILKRDETLFDEFKEKVKSGEISVAMKPIISEIQKQADVLVKLFADNHVTEQMTVINRPCEERPEFKSGDDKYTIKKVDPKISEFISRYCHYLHTPRPDEYAAYGCFEQGSDFPVAYVSYALHDREYKKQILDFMGIESHNSLEMTRAWNMDSAPKNVMSYLFQKSANIISEEWREESKQRSRTGNLQAITTAINPNLGFEASGFFGCNYDIFALKPSRFTYGIDADGNKQYATRRDIQERGLQYCKNETNVLETNDLIKVINARTDPSKEEKILVMDESGYNQIMTAKTDSTQQSAVPKIKNPSPPPEG